ncbi:MAG TPA: hypothetical protein VGP04_15930 [Pseudonocardiaceae bacterium]|nr:hypothetical protein [Pseudonocardiaceae bacterium]
MSPVTLPSAYLTRTVCAVVLVGLPAAEVEVIGLVVGAVVLDAGAAGVVVPQAVTISVAVARLAQVSEAIRRLWVMIVLPVGLYRRVWNGRVPAGSTRRLDGGRPITSHRGHEAWTERLTLALAQRTADQLEPPPRRAPVAGVRARTPSSLVSGRGRTALAPVSSTGGYLAKGLDLLSYQPGRLRR